jgi:hypothetical protein
MDAIVRGLSRIVHPFRVAINAKGGDCWNVYRKSVFFIDGKNKKDDGKHEINDDSTGRSPLLRIQSSGGKAKTRPFNRFCRRRFGDQNL